LLHLLLSYHEKAMVVVALSFRMNPPYLLRSVSFSSFPIDYCLTSSQLICCLFNKAIKQTSIVPIAKKY